MKKPETLQELRNFFAGIPEENWVRGSTGTTYTKQHCGYGHIIYTMGMEIHAAFDYMVKVVPGLTYENDNSPLGPKAGVLKYIDNLIKQTNEKN